MQIVNNATRYCKECHRTHRKDEMITVCPICHKHANQLYNLKIHNLTVSHQVLYACGTCITSLYKMTKKEDPWIREMMGLTDEY